MSIVDVVKVMRRHKLRTGRYPNLLNPKTFTDKVQRAKVTWRSPRMVQFADKVAAKELVAGLLGPEWVTPTLFAAPRLPPRSDRTWPIPYVIKINHLSNGNIFIRSEADLEWDAIEAKVEKWLAMDYGSDKGEWAYTKIPRQVLVEPFIGSLDRPIDYKMYMFGGRFGFTSVNWDRLIGTKRATFDRDWKRLPFVMNAYGDYDGPNPPVRPVSYDEMIAGAEKLATGFPFCRVDLYEIGDRPRFGEVTFYPASGSFVMSPEYDLKVGAMWPPGKPT